jgi:hypothetical protein
MANRAASMKRMMGRFSLLDSGKASYACEQRAQKERTAGCEIVGHG